MKEILRSAGRALIAGLLIVVPFYLAVLLLLKAMKSVMGLVKPFAVFLPDSIPGETILSLLLVLFICFLVGLSARTSAGRATLEKVEKSFFQRIPGYALVRSLTQQMAGSDKENVWKPALVYTDDGSFVPAFIIEEFDDGLYTVFVPSIPTPLAGAVWIVDRTRVHPLDIHFTQALKVISKWGAGSKDLVAAMKAAKA